MSKRYYVYEILVDGLVRYIGKGSGNRACSHISIIRRIARDGASPKASRFHHTLAADLLNGREVAYRFAAKGLTETEAFALEVQMIEAAPKGSLFNVLPGGLGGASSFMKRMWANPKLREERIAALAASVTPQKGERIRQTLRRKWANDPVFRDEKIASLTAARWSGAARNRLSVLSKQRWRSAKAAEYGKAIGQGQRNSEKFRAAHSSPAACDRKRVTGIATWARSDERRRAQSEALREKWANPSWREERLKKCAILRAKTNS
jgi:hypothetical protein